MAFFQTETLWVNELPDGRAVLVLDVPGVNTNQLGRQVLRDLDAALDRIDSRGSFRLLIVQSGKPYQFAAGPSLSEWASLKSSDDFSKFAEQGQRLCQRLETMSMPSVAVLGGPCRGCGLELALACDYRVALAKSTALLTFADLDLGLMPAWGGCQRILRLVGLDRTLGMFLAKTSLAPAAALKYGLIDALSEQSPEDAADHISQAGKRSLPLLPYRSLRQKLVESNRLGRWLLFRGAEAWLVKHGCSDMPAPAAILETLRVSIQDGFDAGLDRSRQGLADLSQSDAFHNLLALHMHKEEQLRSWAAGGAAIPHKAGVIGAGLRGCSLIHLFVSEGYEVTVREIDESTLGLAMFRLLALFQQEIQKGLLSLDKAHEFLADVHATTAWKGFADLGLIIEAISPDLARQQALYNDLETQVAADTPLASTSVRTAVSDLQPGLKHPERLAGLHLLPRAPVVELVRGEQTGTAALQALGAAFASMGRLPLVVADTPGFVVHRVLLAGVLEAVLLVKEGRTPKLIDESMRQFGMTLGPLEWADLFGIDGAAELVASLEAVWSERFPRDDVFPYFVSKGWLGQKTQRGFYRYHKGRPRQQRFLVDFLRERGRQEGLYPGQTLSLRDHMNQARERIVALTANEACWCLEEKLAEPTETVNLALALAGWAPHRGGPFAYVREQGPANFQSRLQRLAQDFGPRFLPCPLWNDASIFKNS